jgi:outer membrane protein TolC
LPSRRIGALGATEVVPARALGIDAAVARAVAHAPGLVAAAAGRDGSAARVGEARAALLPRLDFSESFAHGNGPVYVFGARLEQDRLAAADLAFPEVNHPDPVASFRSRFDLTVPVLDTAAWMALRAASYGRDAADAARAAAEAHVVAATVRAYVALLVAGERMRVVEEVRAAARADLGRIEALAGSGLATREHVLGVQAEVADLEAEHRHAEGSLLVARADLVRWIGAEPDAPVVLTTPLGDAVRAQDAVAVEAIEADAVARHPEVRRAAAQAEASGAAHDAALAAFAPTIAARAGWQSVRPGFARDGGAQWDVGVGLRVNLFNGLGDAARLDAAGADARRDAALRDDVQAAVRLGVRRALAQTASASARVEAARRAVDLARAHHDVERARLERGALPASVLARSRAALVAAEVRHIEAQHARWVAEVDLTAARGLLDRNWQFEKSENMP